MSEIPVRVRMTARTRAVLSALHTADPDDPHWAYRLCEVTGLGAGSVYPILECLEEAEWINGVWETEWPTTRPRRRCYVLTELGKAQYEQRMKALAAKAANRRVTCPSCSKEVLLRGDGALRTHSGLEAAFAGAPFNKVCRASGTLPEL